MHVLLVSGAVVAHPQARGTDSAGVSNDTAPRRPTNHTFSAFWLRSSVVSVLISLISDTVTIGYLDVKLIFGKGGVTRRACMSAPSRVASVLHCIRERLTPFGGNSIKASHFNTPNPHLYRHKCSAIRLCASRYCMPPPAASTTPPSAAEACTRRRSHASAA